MTQSPKVIACWHHSKSSNWLVALLKTNCLFTLSWKFLLFISTVPKEIVFMTGTKVLIAWQHCPKMAGCSWCGTFLKVPKFGSTIVKVLFGSSTVTTELVALWHCHESAKSFATVSQTCLWHCLKSAERLGSTVQTSGFSVSRQNSIHWHVAGFILEKMEM